MEAASAMALRQPIRFPNVAADAASSSTKELGNTAGKLVHLRQWRVKNRVLSSSGFCDQGHLQYYKSSFDSAAATVEDTEVEGVSGRRMSGKGEKSGKEKSAKKMRKKQLKLLKGLSRDLSTFSMTGFGLDCNGTLLDHIKGNMITEATQLLLEQLQKVKAEEKEAKKRMKKEKARIKAAARGQMGANCEMPSSSSSSESSDSECGEVVDMSRLKCATEEEMPPPYPAPIIPTIPSSSFVTDAAPAPFRTSPEEELPLQLPVSPSSKKIEVCMGGKCKKSGAGALLDELKRVVGIEGAVSGCKCMGKCRDGPNVKLVGHAAANSLCIGVGLEDVNVIMAKFIDEHQNQLHQLGFAGAS
ncbi:diacylglycerol O-acyltransferase 3-like [Salvia divinorum]|uniref:Diacylglycerol O-acyltransferase 3-like n=1 Tax=Salvia divinorum TaxID=28513 RepID=A0ABD1IJE4_SALDI